MFVVKNDVSLEVHGNVSSKVGGKFHLNVADEMLVKCKNFKVEATSGGIDMKGSGNLNIDTPEIWMNSNKSTATGLPSVSYTRASPYPPQLPKLTEVERAQEDRMVYETPDEGDPTSWNEQRIDEGEVTKEEIDTKPTPITTDTSPKKIVEPSIATTNQFEGVSSIPMTTKMSPNFTLAKYCQNGTRPIISQSGLTIDKIVYNIQQLSVNCVEPVYKKWPGISITSGFRIAGQPAHASKTSQHNTGQAVDIQFSGVSLAEYYSRIVELKNLIPFDQLLLEYTTKGGAISTAWIHISFNSVSNRSMYFTMKDHKRVSDNGKFVQLA